MPMRPKKSAKDLPPKMLRRSKRLASGKVWTGYYYNGRDAEGKRKEIPLGTDLAEAKRKWAELEGGQQQSNAITMGYVLDRYQKDIVPGKAASTQKNDIRTIRRLKKSFWNAPINEIMPRHIALYRDGRKTTFINNEIGILSHAFDMAREWGYTDRENPTKGVRKVKVKPRDYYVERPVWDAVYSCACDELKDAMDLAYLTGQRPGDVVKMTFHDVRNGALEVKQNKTGKKLRILLDGTELGAVIERIRLRDNKVKSLHLVQTKNGKALSTHSLAFRFGKARKAAAEKSDPSLSELIIRFQFRDIRPMAATDIPDIESASKLLGHTKQEMTKRVYRRKGETVMPTR